jgi:hypothetical protein
MCALNIIFRLTRPQRGDLALLLEVAVEDVRLSGLEEDERGQVVQLVLLVDAVVADLDQVYVRVVKL